MDRQVRYGILIGLSDALLMRGSRNGETHIQKSTYFLQTLANVPLSFAFIPYKHGPFSFELRDELASMRADGFLQVAPPLYHAQAIQGPTEIGLKQWQKYEDDHRWTRAVAWTANTLGNKGVAELERLSTALYVTAQGEGVTLPKSDRTTRLRELKPHITEVEAQSAIDVIDGLIAESQSQFAD